MTFGRFKFVKRFHLQIGRETLEEEFTNMLERDKLKKGRDEILDALKGAVKEDGMKKHQWDEKAEDSLVHWFTSQVSNIGTCALKICFSVATKKLFQ